MKSVVRCSVYTILALLLLCQCRSVKAPDTIYLVVRTKPGEVIHGEAEYKLVRRSNGQVLSSGTTNALGLAVVKKLKDVPLGDLDVQASFNQISTTLALTPFNQFYDVYLPGQYPVIPESERIADFHYHLSMKPHNTFGQAYYGEHRSSPPSNLSWQRYVDKLVVYHKGKWEKPYLKQNISKTTHRQLQETFLKNDWVRSKDGANNFKNFTEATLPHAFEGNVFLAFNAISPFEHSVSNEFVKRVVSSGVKSGADYDWLTIMGKKDTYLTHWANFNFEYSMITSQNKQYNNFHWQFLETKDSSRQDLSIPTVVNVVEGGHILQNHYFPHAINYDLLDSLATEKQALFSWIETRAHDYGDAVTYGKIDSVKRAIDQGRQKFRSGQEEKDKEDFKVYARRLKDRCVNQILVRELTDNISTLKDLDIHMIAVSHLSYNGMVGHAPALDVSKKPWTEAAISALARRAYGIRVSNDKRYKKAYDGLFYRVPGVNAFGDLLITRLLDASQKRRIQIDFKHADVTSRRFLFRKYDEYMSRGDTIRPICSHCAVNGLPIDMSSPLVNEYNMLHSKLSRKFYPFGINLYNEEIKTICERKGIIGIPLEERVLGGYLNNKIEWPVSVKSKHGEYYAIDQVSAMKRSKFTGRVLQLLRQTDVPEFGDVKAYYRLSLEQNAVVVSDKKLVELICSEYFSAEPFLHNLFHIIDIAHTVRQAKSETSVAKKFIRDAKDSLVKTTRWHRNGKNPVVDKDSLSSAATNYARSLPDRGLVNGKQNDWRNVCLGSDLDGLIDPINICPSASQYPFFKEKLVVLIPLFLYIRKNFDKRDKMLGPYRGYDQYFDGGFNLHQALQMVFYSNLKEFTEQTFNK